jgi:hypothetical protein
MSRTTKDRPYWVKVNDPTSPRYPTHKHLAVQNEKVGEELIERGSISWTHGLYKYWYEPVPCTLEIPEENPSSWRFRTPRKVDNAAELLDKHCHYQLDYDTDYVSGKTYKRLTNRAVRGKVRQQLHTALISSLDWDEIDIHSNSKCDWDYWWD